MNCNDCIIDKTDACPIGCGRAVFDDICDEFIPRETYVVNKNESWELGFQQGIDKALKLFLDSIKTYDTYGYNSDEFGYYLVKIDESNEKKFVPYIHLDDVTNCANSVCKMLKEQN